MGHLAVVAVGGVGDLDRPEVGVEVDVLGCHQALAMVAVHTREPINMSERWCKRRGQSKRKVVVLTWSLLLMDVETHFMEKPANATVFFKTRIENSHEKSTLGLKRAKVLFLKRVFNASFEKVL